jgi:hypothetical protein
LPISKSVIFFSDAYGYPLSVYVSGDKQRHLAVAFKQKLNAE